LITNPFSLLALVAFAASVILTGIAGAVPADIATCDRLAAHPDDKGKPAGVKGSYGFGERGGCVFFAERAVAFGLRKGVQNPPP
jgi:hypothetical protein